MKFVNCIFCGVAALVINATYVRGDVFGGIEFPNGVVSFADEVLEYDPLYNGGPGPTVNTDPSLALGAPEGLAVNKCISLGRGGMIRLKFTNNNLVNSGDAGKDLHVFEIGADVEDTYVAIRATAETAALLGDLYTSDEDGYYDIGKVFGSTSSIDIDLCFPGFAAGELIFDAVQLIDDYYEGDSTGRSVGADIDSVGAIGSVSLCDYYLVGDVNYDCAVNILDFALLATNWLIDCIAEPGNSSCIPVQ